ncbi:MAG: cupin domain-containing protein [Gammaproteobacteria bacterium]
MTDLDDINADLSQHIVVDTKQMQWESSPSGTVWRKPLYRVGGEFGPVTSIVKYEAGGQFRTHPHPQGEEIYVLDGEFCDDHGRYPAGTYILNPDGTEHAPFSEIGCTLFVRLRQYDGAKRKQLAVNTHTMEWRQGMVEGLTVLPLYSQPDYPENMALVRWQADTYFPEHTHPGGEEIFVLEGTFEDDYGEYPTGSWIRSPYLSKHKPYSKEGCLIYVRVGGLPKHFD